MRTLFLITFLGVFALLLCFFAVGVAILHSYDMPTRAMEPTLHLGDSVAMGPFFGKEITRGSLVAFHSPADELTTSVSRVVGMPGDHIQVQAGHLILNGKQVYEPYLRISSNRPGTDFPGVDGQLFNDELVPSGEVRRLRSIMYGEYVLNGVLAVPEGMYFMLGDNRSHSMDSRVYGPVAKEAVFARPLFVYSSKAESGRRVLESVVLDVK